MTVGTLLQEGSQDSAIWPCRKPGKHSTAWSSGSLTWPHMKIAHSYSFNYYSRLHSFSSYATPEVDGKKGWSCAGVAAFPEFDTLFIIYLFPVNDHTNNHFIKISFSYASASLF